MTTLTVKSFDGLPLYAVAEGDPAAPAVMLSHSIGCDSAMWDEQARALRGRFYVLRFDRRGHGRSGVPAGDATARTLGRDVLAVMDACGVARAHFVGLSQGGMEGQWLAAHEPSRIDRLVLANTTAYLGVPDVIQAAIDEGFAHGMAAVGNGFLDRWLPQAFRDAHPDTTARLRATFAAMSPQGFAACAAVLKHADLQARAVAHHGTDAGDRRRRRDSAHAGGRAGPCAGRRRRPVAGDRWCRPPVQCRSSSGVHGAAGAVPGLSRQAGNGVRPCSLVIKIADVIYSICEYSDVICDAAFLPTGECMNRRGPTSYHSGSA